jgi:hypothetical protein
MAGTKDRKLAWPRHTARSPWRRFKVFARRYRSTTLFASIIMLIVLAPFYEADQKSLVFAGAWTFVLAVGIYAAGRKPLYYRVALALGAPALLAPWSAHGEYGTVLRLVLHGWVAAFYVFLIFMVQSHILRDRTITGDNVMGGLCTYFLIALAYTSVYEIVVILDPQAIASVHSPGGWAGRGDTSHFSFVTLTTLGYGDMTPVSRVARSLATLEACTGVLYVATFVAWLVSSFRGQRQ